MRYVGGFEYLVKIGHAHWVLRGWDDDQCITHGESGGGERAESEERLIVRQHDGHHADRFGHGQRDIANRGLVNRAVVFVGPCRRGKECADTGFDFGFSRCACGTGLLSDALGELIRTGCQVFSHEVDDLGTIVAGGFLPAIGGGAGGFDGIANIFAVAASYFANQLLIRAIDMGRQAAIRTRLFATDEHFSGAINRRNRN